MQDRYGDTALHIASRHGYTEVVKELLSHRVSKDIINQVRSKQMIVMWEDWRIPCLAATYLGVSGTNML